MESIDIGERCKIISVRFSQAELELLSHRAEMLGTPLSSYIRTMASIPVKFADVYGSLEPDDAIPAMVVYQNELTDARKNVMLVYLNMMTVTRELNAIRKSGELDELAETLEHHTQTMGKLVELYEVLIDLLEQAIRSMRAMRSGAEIIPLPEPAGEA